MQVFHLFLLVQCRKLTYFKQLLQTGIFVFLRHLFHGSDVPDSVKDQLLRMWHLLRFELWEFNSYIMDVVRQANITIFLVSYGIEVYGLLQSFRLLHYKIGNADDVYLRKQVSSGTPLSASDAVLDGESRVKNHSLTEVDLPRTLHFYQDFLLGRCDAVHVQYGFPAFQPRSDLPLVGQGDRSDTQVWQDGVNKTKQQVFIARFSKSKSKCIVQSQVDKDVAFGDGESLLAFHSKIHG